VEKYYRAGQDTDENMAHAHCMLDTQGYKNTLRLCNAHCFSTATMVARTCLNVRLHVRVHCLSSKCPQPVLPNSWNMDPFFQFLSTPHLQSSQ